MRMTVFKTKCLSQYRRGLSRFCGGCGAKWDCPPLPHDIGTGSKSPGFIRACSALAVSVLLVLWLTACGEARVWTSADGAFRVEADLVEARADGTLLLKKQDGQTLRVELAKLSPADQ